MSTEFLGEAARSAKKLGSRRSKHLPKPLSTQPLRAKSKQVVRPRREAKQDVSQLMADLRSGVSRLGQLAGQLAASRRRAQPPQPMEKKQAAVDVTKLVERELRTFAQLVPGATHEVVREYHQLVERAAKLQVPQSHAAILQGAQRLTPAEALHPTSKAVRSLMQAAQAIKQGRLPFLPKETRREAQKLLNDVFSKPVAAKIAQSTRIPKTIEQQRLIPAAARGMLEAARSKDQPAPAIVDMIKRSAAIPLIDVQAPHGVGAPPPTPGVQGRVPIAAHDLPRLARELPSFERQGAATGGSFISHADESVSVITRSDSPLVAPDAATPDAGPVPQAPRSTSTRQPAAAPTGSSASTSGRGGNVLADPARSQSSGPVKLEGTIEIPQLGKVLGEFTGFMRDEGRLT